MLTIGDLQGLWRRSLIVWPDGHRDDTTTVSWLQGPSLYADLRVPAHRPDFEGVTGRDGLTREHVTWLATQEGFSGELINDGDFFEWQRQIDYRSKSASADAGRLWFEDGRLIEEGRDSPYIEHWHRDQQQPNAPCGALQLSELKTGAAGFLVRAGSFFMYARDRAVPLPPGAALVHLVATASLEQAQAMVDCELSFGRMGPSGWLIESSSLPYREGTSLQLRTTANRSRLIGLDGSAPGSQHPRAWAILKSQGDMALANTDAALL